MIMVLTMQCLILAGSIQGFGGALAENGAEEEADLVVGSKFRLVPINRKDVDYAKRERHRANKPRPW
jgi:hypothetical protein